MSVKKLTLRDMAIAQNREKLLHNENVEITERFLLLIGSENSGKTTLINQMLQTEKGSSETASTYLLEYKYGRQSGISLAKNVCHIWELGSGTTFAPLLSVIVKREQPISVVLVLDLTSSDTIVRTAETLLDTVKSLLDGSSNNEDSSPSNSNVTKDEPHLQPFPVPLIIIGGKYDVFQNLEPARKRITCQYLRCLSHIVQADLFFYSKNDNKLAKNVRDILLQYAFGISVNKNNIVTDYNKPLSIPAGHDSISRIEGSPVTSADQFLSKYKSSLLTQFSQELNLQKRIPDDPGKDINFLERAIDNLCAQKEEELERIQKENQRKAAAIESMRVKKILGY